MAIVEYDGTDFAGFQLQVRPGRPAAEQPRTVQAELERAVLAATGQASRVVGSGRTDSGVHAAGQVAHFDTEAALARDLPTFIRALNAHLPADVAVHHLQPAGDTFHARFSATSRTYTYQVLSGPTRAPLLRRYAHHVRAGLAVDRMTEAARHLVGSHDFVAFAGQEAPGSTRREVSRVDVRTGPAGEWAEWAKAPLIWHTLRQGDAPAPPVSHGPEGPADTAGRARLIEIEVEASGFLRHMMRRIAGTLLRVGDGRLEPAEVADILARGDKALAGPTAPARGLCLRRVSYGGSGASDPGGG